MIPGVAQVQIFGAAKYAVRVQVDPNKLAARRIGINEVEDAVQNWNVNIPTGTLFGLHTAFNVQANGQLRRAMEYRPMIVAYRHGAPVRLESGKSTLFIHPHQPRVSRNIRGKNGREPALDTLFAQLNPPADGAAEWNCLQLQSALVEVCDQSLAERAE